MKRIIFIVVTCMISITFIYAKAIENDKLKQAYKISLNNDRLEKNNLDNQENGWDWKYHWTWKLLVINKSGKDFYMKPVDGGDWDTEKYGFLFRNEGVWSPSRIKYRDNIIAGPTELRLDLYECSWEKCIKDRISPHFDPNNGLVIIIEKVENKGDKLKTTYKSMFSQH